MKKILKSCMIILLIILCFSCSKNVNEENKQGVSIVKKETAIISHPIEEKNAWNTRCYTNITDSNVNVRISPSLEAKIIYKLQNDDIVEVRGFSNETMTIDGYNGNWVNIRYTDGKTTSIEGWVFSKYVNIGNMKPAPIRFVEMLPNKEEPEKIKLLINLDGEEVFREVDCSEDGNHYSIVWSPETFGYHYRSIPGVYFLNKDTYELKHFTYSGVFGSSDGAVGWLIFTNDLEFIIQDFGTTSGLRGIRSWRCSTNELVYQGLYYYNSKIIDHTIDVVYIYDDWYYERGFTDSEIMQYGKKFTEENPVPENIEKERIKDRLSLYVIINCTINLDTGERTIIDGEYILI